jgi:hypothetical protein
MVRLPKCKLLDKGIIVGCLLCVMLILVNTKVFGENEYSVEESRSQSQVSRGATYFRTIDLQSINYPVYIHWQFHKTDQRGHHREDPWFQITITSNGEVSTKRLASGTGSYSGNLYIPPNSSLVVAVNVGETRNTHHLHHNYFGYGYYYKINYILDEQPPDAPESPQITSTANGTVEDDIFYTNSELGLTWAQTKDNGSIFYENSIMSGMNDYIVEGSNIRNDSNSSTWDEVYYDSSEEKASSTISMPYNGLFYVRVRARDNQGNISVPSRRLKSCMTLLPRLFPEYLPSQAASRLRKKSLGLGRRLLMQHRA